MFRTFQKFTIYRECKKLSLTAFKYLIAKERITYKLPFLKKATCYKVKKQ